MVYFLKPSLHLTHRALHCVAWVALSDPTNRNWATVSCLVSFNSEAFLFVCRQDIQRIASCLASFLPSCRMLTIVLSIGRCRDWRLIDEFVSVLLFQHRMSPPSLQNNKRKVGCLFAYSFVLSNLPTQFCLFYTSLLNVSYSFAISYLSKNVSFIENL